MHPPPVRRGLIRMRGRSMTGKRGFFGVWFVFALDRCHPHLRNRSCRTSEGGGASPLPPSPSPAGTIPEMPARRLNHRSRWVADRSRNGAPCPIPPVAGSILPPQGGRRESRGLPQASSSRAISPASEGRSERSPMPGGESRAGIDSGLDRTLRGTPVASGGKEGVRQPLSRLPEDREKPAPPMRGRASILAR